MELKTSSLADRPDMVGRVLGMADSWPEFVVNDLVGNAHYPRIAAELPQYVQFAEDERGEVVAHAHSVPFALGADGRGELPARGWDEVLAWAFSDLRHGVRPDTVSAISVVVAPHAQGHGLSGLMLAAMRANAAALGFREVVAPVRPSAKHLEPRTPIEDYARRVRPDGLPHDPWLRVHARAGARSHSVAPASMTVAAPLEDWRRWTGLPFDTVGDIEVPGALVPVRCEPERGYAVYVEPNVWMRLPLSHGRGRAGAGGGARLARRDQCDNGSVQHVTGCRCRAIRSKRPSHDRRRRHRPTSSPHFRHQEQPCMATATRSR